MDAEAIVFVFVLLVIGIVLYRAKRHKERNDEIYRRSLEDLRRMQRREIEDME